MEYCENCHSSLDRGELTLPWEDGDNKYAYVTCPHCGYTEDDWCNDAYDVNDDEEILHMKRVCSHCGKEFTLLETAKEYDSLMGWPYYTHQFVGDLCYGCAIEEMRSRFPEYYDEKAGD